MDWGTIGKYTAALALNAGIFYLVYVQKVDPQVFVAMATTQLTGLGLYHVTVGKNGNGDGNGAAPAAVTNQGQQGR